ncbi:helical backbone metal receptor [Basidiobolus meristosporus CBS 931.73]|uniref:Helical backbone metal receptor n=1 Tax=Basidiobolus meristosporus CBS 931.73 TaxID=1314790 RepID=A0A1Y1YW55_9FUNG|nr:helical backbone metal receptor [Basidiobolus meristosporus CBS 931.73]|eukprot:ORY01795.1 helical backbone metal receptor [Basidiobolus meristosporus CBS 931.73]
MTVRKPKVISLLPSATEIIGLIPGGAELLVGRSHEDDYPESILDRPYLTAQKTTFTDPADVDRQVSETLAAGQSLYTLNVDLIKKLQPEVILTQSLCKVCAIDLISVERVAASMSPQPQIVDLNPNSLGDVLENITSVGKAVGLEEESRLLQGQLRSRIERIERLVKDKADFVKPKCLMMEWPEPIYAAGHWTPQIIEMAGGLHPLNPCIKTNERGEKIAKYGKPVTPESVVELQPDIIIIAPCGLDLVESEKQTKIISEKPWWKEATKNTKKVYLVDGSHMFNRPGPRLVDALEFCAGVILDQPELIPEGFPVKEWKL